MNIRNRLKTHASLLRKIQITEQQLKGLSEGITLAATTDPSRDSVQGGEIGDRLPLKLHQIETIRKELESLYVLRDQEHDELWKIVGSLTDVFESCVLRSYYFSLQGREEVAQQLFGNEEDFQQRRKYYLNRVSKVHTKAMNRLESASKD
ncbi:MAG: hypothetical protein FWD93_04720 [Coriobacteriia bacterium]|nr:hypothetical protein [Coriobacteriia bacterium]